MSLARAFTTRRMRSDNMPQATAPAHTPYVGRAASQRGPNPKPINRSKISLPVALISTTNMLSYDAPDIAGTPRIVERKASTAASTTSSGNSSAEDSDGSSNQQSSTDNHTDASSVDESFSASPVSNSKEFFNSSPVAAVASDRFTPSHKSSRSLTSPTIPQRAASHSKVAHERVSRQRSVQRNIEPSHSSVSSRDSSDMFSGNYAESTSHPFAGELEQLTEIAEEYGSTVRDVETEADLAVMRAHGLVQFCAAEYMSEIAALSTNFFDEDRRAIDYAGWI